MNLLSKKQFQSELEGKIIDLFTLSNSNGIHIQICNFGARVVSLFVPDKGGEFDDIVLGFPCIEDYLKHRNTYFGATIGRYANRIAKGQFDLNGKTYFLSKNNGNNHLHGGNELNNVVWKMVSFDKKHLKLKHVSPDGEMGYPGTVEIFVNYSLSENNELEIEYFGESDQDTILNLTHHSFFNLKGEGRGDILAHQIRINAKQFTPINDESIPLKDSEQTDLSPFDFNQLNTIGERINVEHQQVKNGKGYDHNFVLNKTIGAFGWAAKVVEPSSGRTLEVFTDKPGLQFYSGNFLDGTLKGKRGETYGFRSGFCLEPQFFPNSPNRPDFPSTILKKGENYYSKTMYQFGVL